MDHEHGREGAAGCKLCESRRIIDFGQGSREQSFRGLAAAPRPEVIKDRPRLTVGMEH